MKSRITPTATGVDIDVTEVGEHAEAVLAAFNQCQQGKCSCPTTTYEQVADVQVTPVADGVSLTVTARPGETLDVGDIERCLAHTEAEITRKSASPTHDER